MKVNIGPFPKSGNRKILVQVDRHDSYNVDSTLAYIILPVLHQLKNTMHGVPGEFADVGGEDYNSQLCFDFYSETHNEAFELSCKKWNEILDKMIWSFQQIVFDDYEKLYRHGDAEYDWAESDHEYPNPISGKMEKTFTLVDKNPNDHWHDFVGQQLHEQRIQEGLELFGKYYRNLWD